MNNNYNKNNNNNIKNMKNFTRGGQITFHNIRMLLQVNKTIWKIYLAFFVILIISSIYLITPNEILQNSWYWCLAKINPMLELLDFKLQRFSVPYQGRIYNISPKTYLSHEPLVRTATGIVHYLKIGLIIGFILSFGAFYLLVKWLISRGKDQTANGFIRGGRLDTVKNVAKQIKKRKLTSDIVIDGMPMIAGSEVRHFLMHGSTGTGKTQLISKFLDHLQKRKDKVVVYDIGGIYTSTFYRRGQDKILNPLDARSEDWDLWREAREATDFASLAASLIPRPAHTDPYWADSARSVFANLAYTMQDKKDRSIKNMLKFLLTAPLEELHRYLADTEAAALVSNKIEKTSLSIRSVMATYTKSLKFLTALEQQNTRKQKSQKPKFCIKDWLNDKNTDEWLFITSTSEQHEALRPLVSMWFSMATIALMNSTSTEQRRIWFVCDELPSMHQLPQLTTALAQGRKYGGCFILGMQNYAQLESIYERSGAEGIFDNIHTRFFFRSPSAQMAELVSRELGNQEIQHVQETYSYGANSIRDGITLGSQKMTNRLVMPSEIMDLETMNCYLRLAGAYPITKLSLDFEDRPTIEPGFVSGKVKPDQEISSLMDSFGYKVRKIPPQKTKTEQSEQSEQHEEKYSNNSNSSNTSNTQNTANSSSDEAQVEKPRIENIPKSKSQELFNDW